MTISDKYFRLKSNAHQILVTVAKIIISIEHRILCHDYLYGNWFKDACILWNVKKRRRSEEQETDELFLGTILKVKLNDTDFILIKIQEM